MPEQLVDEAALPDAGHADEGHELRLALVAGAREAPRKTSSSRSRPTSSARARARRRRRTASERPSASHTAIGSAFPFASTGGRLPVVDRAPRRPVRRLVDEDPVHRRRRLQARSRVDDVARGHALARGRAASSETSASPVVIPIRSSRLVLEREVADRERGANGALGVVLVRVGRAEERHHGVADELLHRAAVALELGADALVVRARACASTSSGSIASARDGEADEVAEEDGHDLALAARLGHHAVLASSASPRSMKRVAPTER